MSRQYSPRSFKFVVMLVLVVAFAGYGGYRVSVPAMHRRRVADALPLYLDALRSHRDQLSRAIEEYHTQLGFYPPNASPPDNNRPTLNPLYYELVGTRWHPNEHWFGLPTTKQPITPDALQKSFNLISFSNTTQFPTWPKNFLQQPAFTFREENGVLLLVSVRPSEIPDDLADDFVSTPWRYTTAPAAHNPTRFDLWMELRVSGQTHLVTNW